MFSISQKFSHQLMNTRALITGGFKDQRGAAAIEFVFIAPLLIAMYFGLAEMASAITVDRKVSHASSVAGDLVTQYTSLSSTDAEEVLDATLKVLSIPAAYRDRVNMEILSFSRDSSGNPVEEGRIVLNGSYPGQAYNPAGLSSQLLNTNSGIIVSRITYNYKTLNLRFLSPEINLTETFMLKPRKSALVRFVHNGSNVDFSCSSTENSITC